MAGNEAVRIWANGCFDVFHFGHANFLRQAKSTGDYLIAGVHSDADIGENKLTRPVMGEAERTRVVSAVRWVDEVRGDIPYGEVVKILDENACDFCAHGDDIARDASGRDIYAESKERGRFKECKRTEGISTTMIIDRVLLAAGGEGARGPPHADDGDTFRAMSDEYYEERMNEFCSASAEPAGDCEIVYSQGVFDLFHSGHVDFLEKCRRSVAGDAFVVIGVLGDEEVRRVFGSYPVTNTYERALAVMACKFVDKVEVGVAFEVTAEFLDRLKVDCVCHGRLWELPSDPYLAAKKKKIFRQLDSGNDTTTNTIIQRVLDNQKMYSERNSKKPESLLSKMVLNTNDV